jgi:dihydroxyacetone kinase
MPEERRRDPADGQSYTYKELVSYYTGTYTKGLIKTYWDQTCVPLRSKGDGKGGKGKAVPKAKAKAKVKVKAKAEKGPANPKRFVDDLDDIVRDGMDGLIWSTPNLARLDTFPSIKVVFRTDWNKDQVALISGGGAGHEPMHGGLVGKGLLTAAISGETFASPSIDAVLSAIVQVTGPQGCLLIIKNYTGDRLNFTLAAQRARDQFGLKVETVITCDDVATVAERGIAGTLFVHKVCGAAAAAGKSLAEIKALADKVIESTASEGVAFSSVKRLKAEMIGSRKMEIGLGIHGEPGSRTEDKAPVSKIVNALMQDILKGKRMEAPAPDGYACIVNNLGSVPPLEMCVIVNALMKSEHGSKIKLLIGPAQLCTSLDMNGFSLSLLRLNKDFVDFVKAPTCVTIWPPAVEPVAPKAVPGIGGLDPMEGITPSSDEAVSGLVKKMCAALIAAKAELDGLDAKVGDGDCGSTMANASKCVLDELDKLPLVDPEKTCRCLGATLGKAMGGSSGVLLSIMFMGMQASFAKSGKKSWAEGGAQAFQDGLQAMMDAGGAKAGSRTMLDALLPAAQALTDGKGLAGAKQAAEQGVEATKTMPPRAGRSENVPESAWKSIPDPGAKAVAIAFGALA